MKEMSSGNSRLLCPRTDFGFFKSAVKPCLRGVVILACIFVAGLSLAAGRSRASIVPVGLTCEHAEQPLIDFQRPRLSWINENRAKRSGAAQSAYRICVAESPDGFSAPLWDTGCVESSESVYIPYDGPELSSRTTYWWRVMVWDERGRPSKWSEPALWHMGMLSDDDWIGEWIGVPWQDERSYDAIGKGDVQPAPLLRREFDVAGPVRSARFYGTGLGWFELYVNGSRVGEDYFVPNQTNYDRRPKLDTRFAVLTDPFEEYTVMYVSYDVTDMLRQGRNAVGAILGNGFYDMVAHWPAMGYGSPRFMGQIEIEYDDGSKETVASDCTWRTERSAIVSDQVFFGEHYDARLEHDGWAEAGYDDSAWAEAVPRLAPTGKLIAHNGPADRITQRYRPLKIEKTDGGAWRVEFPEEVSGWVGLQNIDAQAGQRIDIKYICESHVGKNSYTARGTGDESYHARFTWFVFSAVEISGLDTLYAEQVSAHAVNSDVRPSGHFVTSNGLINRINDIWKRSQLDNMHGSLPSDCPHRERSPYTGDGQLACVTTMYNFDARTFYNKWIRDIRGAQKEDGYVPNSAPWQPGCAGGVAWGAAMEIVPWEFYMHYGDERVLEQNFEAMCRHVRWMTTWVDDSTGVMLCDYPEKWKNLGDWLPPRDLPPTDLVHTFFLWHCSDIAARAAEVLGREAERTEFAALRDSTLSAFHRAFFNTQTSSYGNQTCNVLALRMGLGRPQLLGEHKNGILRTLYNPEIDGHLDTGIIGTRYLFEVLCDMGMADLAYAMINKRDFPSFGYWIEQGATVTWENWNGEASHNHPMFGGGLGWFYRDLAGLRSTGAGFRTFDIRPKYVLGLDSVEYTHKTVYGDISIKWNKIADNRYKLRCRVPVGTTATVWVPVENCFNPEVKTTCGKEVEEKVRREFGAGCGIAWHVQMLYGYALYEVGAGEYEFESVCRNPLTGGVICL